MPVPVFLSDDKEAAMKKMFPAALLAAAVFCGGCQSMKKMLNDEPKPRKKEVRGAAPARESAPEVFPGSRRRSQAPSMLSGELSAGERAALDESMRDTRIPSRDLRMQDKRDNKAASDWVFGR